MQQRDPLTGSAAVVSGASARAQGFNARLRAFTVRALLISFATAFGAPTLLHAPAQNYPGAGCVATLENRSVLVDSTGSYSLPNIPVDPGQYRVRVICPQPDGTTQGSTSAFQNLVPLGVNTIPTLPIGPMGPQPSALKLVVIAGALSSVGSTATVEIQAITPDGFAYDASQGSEGATYSSSNLTVATVDANGIVTATGPGNVVITARYDGLVSTIMLTSFALADSDGDGMPDAYEIANGLNPYDPTDASQDPDHDGLTNLQEYQLGTNPHAADTDGDGLNDGDEIKLGTNPLVADTDGDGLSDGDEVRLGTNPLNPDTDGDGIPDGIEVKLGLNPLVPDVTTTVTGHVTNPDGTPYSGATTILFTYFTASTDSTGAFTLLHIPTTLGNLVVSAKVINGTTVLSGASKATPAVPNAVTDVGTIQLGQSAGQVSGIVSSPDNHPVNLAQVTIASGNDTRTATTDASGLYVVTGLQAGPVSAAAFDPATSLRGQASGVLSAGGPLTLNVKLAGYGTVAGTVRNPAGAALGAGITVSIQGALNATTVTDTLGHYSFPFVPLGYVQLDATDANGNHGRASATVTVTSQNINTDIQYLGRGTVSGVVSDGTNTPVGGAVVQLNNGGLFNQSLTTTTNSLGQYSFSQVFVGTIYLSAQLAATQTAGAATTAVQSDGQTVTANIKLQPTATLSGIVYRADATTKVPGAVVTLSGTAFTATADSTGTYSIANVPLGNYTALANDPSTGDRGAVPVTLNTVGQTVPLNIDLLGLGTAVVTVVDGGGAIVPGALVSINTGSPFFMAQNGVTGADGTVTFNQQLAGSQSVSASNPATGLGGVASVTITPNNTSNVTVQLQASGSVQGTVYRLDGVTPLAGATVQLDSGQTVLTSATGTYAFAIVSTGTHRVAVLDAANNVLAFNNNIVISSQGQVVMANFVIVGRGTVTGEVINTDGTPAANVPVQVMSQASGQGNALGTQTNANGIYTVPNVAIGSYTVSAQEFGATVNAYGTATGTLPSDGSTATTNVQLSSSLVPATVTFTDANGFIYPVRQNAGLFDGAFTVFAGDSAVHEGGSLLSLVQNGTETAFTGAPFAPVTLNAQQISIEQDGLDGLNVTRRVYVPGDGYFARYLELLKNPTAQPITVDVKLTSNYRNDIVILRSNSTFRQVDPPHILMTSSGDTQLNVTDPNTPDHWLTLGGSLDQDPFLPDVYADQYIPPIADVFDGPGAQIAPSSATYTTDSADTYSAFTHTYSSVTIPAGATVGIMHFISEENLYVAANASATRLAQLPPEALAGLTQQDLATIENFNVPAGGVSTVAPLTSLTNTVGGFVFAADGSTVVPGAGVSYHSNDAIFDRTYVTQADSTGAFSYTGSFHGLAIPAEGFTVTATHPLTAMVSPDFSGAFAAGSTVATQNIIFSSTGTIQGTVSRGPTVLNVAGYVVIGGGGLANTITLNINADGTYQLTGVPQGTYSIIAYVTNTLLSGQTSTTVSQGQTVTANITIGEAGNIQGTVTRPNGTLAIGDTVNLRQAGSLALQAQVNTAGGYAFTDIPIGTYTVDSYDASSNSSATAAVVVGNNATVTQNLALTVSGSVTGVVTVNDGSSVANLTITLTSTTSNGTQTLTTTTDTTGHYSFTNVNPGTILLRTTTPAGLQGSSSGSLPLAGQSIVINLSLTAAGSLTGTVFQADGHTPAIGVQVTLSPAPLTGNAVTTTDANGMYSYSLVAIGGFTVFANNLTTGDQGSSTGQIQTNGQARVINVTLNGFGSITVIVQDASSRAIANASVTVFAENNGASYKGTTDSTGTAQFAKVFAGPFSVGATDPVTGLSANTGGTVTAGGTASVTLKLQPLGTIQGVVYAPDGVTPEVGVVVTGSSSAGQRTTAADGSFQFAGIPLGYYNLSVADKTGAVRAVVDSVALQTNGMTVTQNLTFIGVGSVSGTVANPDGTPLENAQLEVVSLNSVIGNNQYVTTGGDGTYSVPELPVGKFTITVTNLPSGLAGFGNGTIAVDGLAVTLNIQLVSSTITLPTTLTDADGFSYTISADGSFANTGAILGLSPFYDTQVLTINNTNFAQGGAPTTAIQTLNGQQIEINQPSLAGLNVTRKIYVPTNGYFSRRLDVLQNTTSSPITVPISINGYERATLFYPSVVTTSSGTATVDNSILWDVQESGPLPYPGTQPATATVFAGTGAPLNPATVTENILNQRYTQFQYYYYTQWNYAYSTVTVPANSTVSFLLFTAQEAMASTATTAAQRLEQLPAEALAGLTPTDLASIVNFVVPAAPLAAVFPPDTTYTLSGHVFASDDMTPVPNAVVYAQSTDLYYGVGVSTTADGTGVYGIPALLANSYAAEAVDPVSNLTSPIATGTAVTTSPNQLLDIPFANTGIVQLLVQATGTTSFVGGSGYLGFPCTQNVCGLNISFGPSGTVTLLNVPAGSYGFSVNVQTAQGGSIQIPLNGSINENIQDAQTTQVVFTVPPTGTISGTVMNADGTPAAGVTVGLGGSSATYFNESTKTDANGNYIFSSIPLDTYTVSSQDPITLSVVSKTSTVTQDTTNTVNLVYIGKGTVVATVHYANGNIGANSSVYISTSTVSNFTYVGQTDGNGQFTFTNVPTGAYSIEAYYPSQYFYTTTTGTLSGNGTTQQLPITLTPVGTISGQVTNADGTPAAAGSYVQIVDAENSYQTNAQTDAAGNYGIFPVPADRTVTVYSYPNTNTTGRTIEAIAANQQIQGDGQTLTVNLRYPGQANVAVTAQQENGTPYSQGYLSLKSTDGVQRYSTTIPSNGTYTFTNVVEATFVASYQDIYGNTLGSKIFTITAANDGTIVPVTITTSPTGNVQGQVFASDGVTPLLGNNFGVTLLDIDTGNQNGSDNSGGNGAYTFADSRVGANGVQVGASGFKLTAEANNIPSSIKTATGNFTADGQTITQNFTLPVSAISGTVYLNDGVTPVPYANVYGAQTIAGTTVNYNVNADANGSYQMLGPVTGSLTINATDNNGIYGTTSLTLATDTSIVSTANVSLGPVGTVMGTVYDANGVLQTSVEVDIYVPGGALDGSYYQFVYTDQNGNYQATDVPVGTVTVTAYTDNNSSATNTGVLVNNGDVITVNIGSPPPPPPPTTGLIFGTVYDSNQNPAPGATVTAVSADGSITQTATTDDNGMYNVGGFAVGDVNVSAVLADSSTAGPVTGTISDITIPVEVDLGINNYGNVSGIVYDNNGNPLGDLDIYLNTTGDPDSVYVETSNDDGTYGYGGIPAGTVTITVNLQGTQTTIGTATGVLPYGGNVVINVTTNPSGSGLVVKPRLRVIKPASNLAQVVPAMLRPPAISDYDEHQIVALLSAPSIAVERHGGLW